MSSLRLICINDVYTLEYLPRLATLVARARRENPADVCLVTLAGDFVAPSLLSGLDAGRGMVDCLNAIGVTHVTLGNHEDDIPTTALRLRIGEFRGCWLGTNIDGLDTRIVREDIIQVGARRVGLIGVVMDDPAAYRQRPFGGARIAPPNATAQTATADLLARGCACVIPLTHQSVADDRRLAEQQRNPPFALIVGGHEHSVFLEEIGTTHLIKAGADAIHAVVVDIDVPDSGPPVARVKLEAVADYSEDATLRALVDQHMQPVHELERATLLALGAQKLSSVGTRMQQTTLGTLLCSRIRDALGADACVINGGGIRASREYERHFTYADLKAELPFENAIVVAALPGKVLAAAVAASRARAPAESGGFLQVDDRMVVDGSVVRTVAGEPLDDNRVYHVALIRDLFGGMDHQEPLLRFAVDQPWRVPPVESGREVKSVLVRAFAESLWQQLGGFDHVDANHDGGVTEGEIAAAIAQTIGEPPSLVTAELVLDALDTDHDHRLSRAETAALDGKTDS